LLNKLLLTFLFSPFCPDIKNIEPKLLLRTNVLNSRTMYLNIANKYADSWGRGWWGWVLFPVLNN